MPARRSLALLGILAALALFALAACEDDDGAPTATPTPSPSPTASPTPSPTATPTPTASPDTSVTHTPTPPGATPTPPTATPTIDPDRMEVLAPIVRLELTIAESFPPQYFVSVTSALPDGCTKFSRYEVMRDDAATTIHVAVYNTVPRDQNAICTAIYGEVTNNVPLGSDFEPGVSYTVEVNDQSLDFVAQ